MNLIEVFIEDGCESCERVTDMVTRFASDGDIMVRVYERRKDIEMFYERGVVICPATCINGKLAFYGEFSVNELQEYVSKKEPSQGAVPMAKPIRKPKASWLQLIRNLIAGFVVIGTLMFVGIQCSKQPSADMVDLSGGVPSNGSTMV